MANIGLIFPTQLEIPENVSYEGPRKARLCRRGDANIQRLRFNSNDISLVVSGVGMENASAAAEKIFYEGGSDYLLALGFCGSLREEYAPGHLILAEEALYGDEHISLESAYFLSATKTLESLGDFSVGAIQTFDNPVLSRAGTKNGAIAADMESYALAEFSREYSVLLVVLRAVTDVIPDSPISPRDLLREIRGNSTKAKERLGSFLSEFLKQ